MLRQRISSGTLKITYFVVNRFSFLRYGQHLFILVIKDLLRTLHDGKRRLRQAQGAFLVSFHCAHHCARIRFLPVCVYARRRSRCEPPQTNRRRGALQTEVSPRGIHINHAIIDHSRISVNAVLAAFESTVLKIQNALKCPSHLFKLLPKLMPKDNPELVKIGTELPPFLCVCVADRVLLLRSGT